MVRVLRKPAPGTDPITKAVELLGDHGLAIQLRNDDVSPQQLIAELLAGRERKNLKAPYHTKL